MSTKRSIVVLGAGFGGLRAALLLGRKLRRYKLTDRYRVVLIDKNDYHTYSPTLYEVATTAKELANLCELKQIVTIPIVDIIRNLPIEFIKAEVSRVDLKNGDIHLVDSERVRYQYAIFALGSETNYYNIPGLAEHSYTLKTFADAVKIRERITDEAMDPERGNFQIVIGGAGSTGVELAGEIQNWLCSLGKNTEKVCWANISLVEGASTILSSFGPKIVSRAKQRFDSLGAIRIAHKLITKITDRQVFFDNGDTLSYDMFIWTGGVKSNRLMEDLASQIKSKDTRFYIDANTHCAIDAPTTKIVGPVYAIGDSACFIDPRTQKPVPMVARAALSQAKVASLNLLQEILYTEKMITQRKLRSYKPMEYPYVIPIGGKFAIAKVGSLIIHGFFGWVLKGLVELNYLLSIMPKWRAIKLWFKGLRIFIQNDQLG